MEPKNAIRNTEDIRKILTEEIVLVKGGKSTPSRANSICNLVAKILSSAKLDIEFHRYVQKANVRDIAMTLVNDGKKPVPAQLTSEKSKA